MAYGYEKDIDYKTLMENAAKSGDMARAAIFEAQNNERINGEGLPVQQTSLYSQYLPAQQNVNPYQQELEKTMNGATVDYLLGGDAISAYKKAYLREADRTGRDTLGQYAAMTGGIPSTQAVAAASQAADYQKSKLAEQLPNLYQQQIDAAMNRWKELGAADERVAQILGVQVGALTADQAYQNWNRKMQEDQFAWQKEQQARSDSYSLALTLLQSGQMPSDDLLTAAGISQVGRTENPLSGTERGLQPEFFRRRKFEQQAEDCWVQRTAGAAGKGEQGRHGFHPRRNGLLSGSRVRLQRALQLADAVRDVRRSAKRQRLRQQLRRRVFRREEDGFRVRQRLSIRRRRDKAGREKPDCTRIRRST